MYICPTCQCGFETEQQIQKHFLSCWKEQHPFHIAKEAPHLEDITNSSNEDLMRQFFGGLINE